jgi:hypothetical protein
LTLDGPDGVAIASRDGNQSFECPTRHCSFRRTITGANYEALIEEARSAGRRYVVIP